MYPTKGEIYTYIYDFWVPNDFRSCLIYERLRCAANNSFQKIERNPKPPELRYFSLVSFRFLRKMNMNAGPMLKTCQATLS